MVKLAFQTSNGHQPFNTVSREGYISHERLAMSQPLTPERIGSHRIPRGNFGFPNQAGPDSPIENTPFEHPQASQWHQSVPQSSSLGMPATIYTPNATTSTFSESGQPGSMIDDNYQGRHSTTGSLSSFAFVETFYNDFTPQSPVPNGQSDISTRGSGGNYNRMSADHANRSAQENEIEVDFDEYGSEDESDQRGLAGEFNSEVECEIIIFGFAGQIAKTLLCTGA